MLVRSLVGLAAGLCLLLGASFAHAQCSKDTDCKGDRLCDAGACVAPPPAPAGAAAPAPAAATDPAAAAPPPQPLPPAAAPPPLPEAKPRRHSTGMMAGGIVMVSFVPIALLVALVANSQQAVCETGGIYVNSNGGVGTFENQDCSDYDPTIYGALIVAAGLAGGGIPMIVIGGKREPAATASITPWATPHGAGIGLRLDL